MVCTHVALPGGGSAIVCGTKQRKKPCVQCGKPSDLLCDWKMRDAARSVREKGSPTCDAPICAACSHSPAPDKDLCPTHANEWKARLSKGSGNAV